jgi:hypothetical protein
MRRRSDLALLHLDADMREDSRRRRRRQTIGLVIVLAIEFALVGAVAIAVAGCIVDAPELDCPGGLYCACELDTDCEGHGLGGPRGTCALGMCTHACIDDDDCGDGVCGPLDVRGVTVCNIPCAELGEVCEIDDVDATCVDVGIDGDRVCGGDS